MRKSILERLKRYLKPGTEELAELIKLIEDMKYLQNDLVTIQKLLSDLEFREEYYLENERLKDKIKFAEEMYPKEMAIVNDAIKVIDNRKKESDNGE